MSGFAEALREDYNQRPIDALGVEYTQRIEDAARRMDALVQGLLDFGRVAAGPLEIRAVSLGELVHRALGRLSGEISGRGAQVEVSPGLPDVATDDAVLELTLVHLLSNALKFVPPGARPEVKVRAEPCPRGVRLLVEDNGIGIDERYRDRMFGLFEQLHPPETYPGTGIGLAIVKKAMERMGGRVDLRSGPGRGSTFWIELPCAKSAGL
jgi:signal transduction histidine kinase